MLSDVPVCAELCQIEMGRPDGCMRDRSARPRRPLSRRSSATHFTSEDFLITLRYAENLAGGHGFVYNPGERVLGTTTPLYALFLALAAALGLPADGVGKAVNILADGALCLADDRLASPGGARGRGQDRRLPGRGEPAPRPLGRVRDGDQPGDALRGALLAGACTAA